MLLREHRRAVTARALAIGLGVGALAAISNLYVSLRTGWTLPVMTTAVLVGFAVTAARREGQRLGPRESTIVSAIASAAGYMAGGGNAAALPALAMIGEHTPSIAVMAIAWVAVAALGTFTATLLRPGTIDGRELAFPTAMATATLTQVLSDTTAEAKAKAQTRALAAATISAAGLSLLRNLARAPATIPAPGHLGNVTLASLTFGIDPSFVLVGAGGLMTIRTALSTLASAIVTYAIIVPTLLDSGVMTEASYRAAVEFMVWPSATLLVASALVTFMLDLPKLLRQGNEGANAEAGTRNLRVLVLMVLVVALVMTTLVGLPVGAVVLAFPLAFALAFVAARAMGETDIVPTKALTPLAQLLFGAAGAGVATTSLAPNVTSGVALHAADTLGTLKVAKATDTAPLLALLARVLGCVVGGVAVAAAYALLVRDAHSLPTNELPVPGVLVWKSVAIATTRGLGALPSATKNAMGVAAGLGFALALLERVLPNRLAAWVPSPVGLGSGMVLPASNAIAMTVGAVCRHAFAGRSASREAFVVPIASGLVAGESIVGIVWQTCLSLGLRSFV